MNTIVWIITHRRSLFKGILVLSVAFLTLFSTFLYKQNKRLSESLEMAHNNIEAYQGLLNNSQQANNVLQLSYDELKQSKDSVVHKLDSVRKELKIKQKQVKLAATQTQVINVNASKELKEQVIVKDTMYTDSIEYNPLTKVYYTIGNDTINIGLNIQNTEYLYITSSREYVNKKNFFKRLFTWDWKKETRTTYQMENTNELFDVQDVRIIEIQQ